MHALRASVLLVAATLGSPSFAHAQTLAELNRAGVEAMGARDPEAARRAFARALDQDSLDYEANWRMGLALVDIAKQRMTEHDPVRDSLYAEAVRHARRAIAIDSADAEGVFVLALALGQNALHHGRGERLGVAQEVHDLGLRALALDSLHDGAHHLLGRWHAEAKRLSGISRFFARTFLGGGVLRKASWEEAVRHLELAVRYRPEWIYHRLDLARVYVDRKRYAEARTQLEAIATLPLGDVLDEYYRREAADLLQRIKGR